MFYINKISIHRINLDWLLGLLVAIPFAYPKEPFYWIIIFVFLISCYRLSIDNRDVINLSLILLFIAYIALVNICNSVYNLSVFGSCLSVFLLLFRYVVKDTNKFLQGISFTTTIYALSTFAAFLILKPYTYGLFMFINSDYREWADGYLIEWPNVFCAFLVIGGFIHYINNNKKISTLHFVAAVLTTSRTSLLAIAILIMFTMIKRHSFVKYVYVVISLLALLTVYLTFSGDDTFNSLLQNRLFKTSDRSEIYNTLLESSYENVFGIGNVPFEELDASFESYHSSYLKVLSRYGIIGLIFWLLLTFPKNIRYRFSEPVNMPILFIMLCGIVQDFMFHMHILAIYSVILSHREIIIKERDSINA